MIAAAKIIEGLKAAVAGNFSAVTIEGQRWVRVPELEDASILKARQRISAAIASPNANGCKLWTGKKGKQGYGECKLFGRRWAAHRAAWTFFVEPIPDGMNVLHKCDVRSCVNVDHLFLGTIADNVADMDRKGRRRSNRNVPWLTRKTAILTEAQVIEIFHRNSAGERYRDLAEEYGVSPKTIGSIVRGENWSHLGLRSVA